jgi:hypothetical protein
MAVAATDGMMLITAALLWLAVTNGSVAIFTLLPRAPWTALRPLIWRRTGDYHHVERCVADADRLVSGLIGDRRVVGDGRRGDPWQPHRCRGHGEGVCVAAVVRADRDGGEAGSRREFCTVCDVHGTPVAVVTVYRLLRAAARHAGTDVRVADLAVRDPRMVASPEETSVRNCMASDPPVC